MSASSSQGIHTLLEAEKAASLIVEKAREGRVRYLKEARSEAAKAIAKLQAQKNEELAAIQRESADQTELSQSIEADTQQKLAAIRAQFEANKAEAVRQLVEAVSSAPLDAPTA
ncbi:hypothetical protein H4R18_002119 [Coemansia javaensis]|uniref:V-type proton ATPase subunit G n=1 Tax=Coemansia javaensis TaxID=2761396 RepID=A0A9W8HDT9_9FUNG|nr:hypothetical protein H4R18_002119 [Coemansia javaensis]